MAASGGRGDPMTGDEMVRRLEGGQRMAMW
jgi:hypothetical protein